MVLRIFNLQVILNVTFGKVQQGRFSFIISSSDVFKANAANVSMNDLFGIISEQFNYVTNDVWSDLKIKYD